MMSLYKFIVMKYTFKLSHNQPHNTINESIIGIKQQRGNILYTCTSIHDTEYMRMYALDDIYEVLAGDFKLHFKNNELPIYQKKFNIDMNDFTQYNDLYVSKKHYMRVSDYRNFKLDDIDIIHKLSLSNGEKLTINLHKDQHYNHAIECAYKCPVIRMDNILFDCDAIEEMLLYNNIKYNTNIIEASYGNTLIICDQLCSICNTIADGIITANGLKLSYRCRTCNRITPMFVSGDTLNLLLTVIPSFDDILDAHKEQYIRDLIDDIHTVGYNIPKDILDSIQLIKADKSMNVGNLTYIVAKIAWEASYAYVVDTKQYIEIIDNTTYIYKTKLEMYDIANIEFILRWCNDKTIRKIHTIDTIQYTKHVSELYKKISLWFMSFIVDLYMQYIKCSPIKYKYLLDDFYVYFTIYNSYNKCDKSVFDTEMKDIFNTTAGCIYTRIGTGMIYKIENIYLAYKHALSADELHTQRVCLCLCGSII